MAIQKDTEYIGTLGNLIYYKRKDIYCIRTVPSGMRQTEASKLAAINFGKVSSRSKIIRQYFDGFIAAPRDKDMQKRLKKVLLQSIHFKGAGPGEMPTNPLMGFRFNNVLPLAQRLGFNLHISEQVEGAFKVEIPEMNPVSLIEAPTATSRVQLEIKVFSFSFDHDRTSAGTPVIINIPYTNATQPEIRAEMETLFDMPGLSIFVAALSYWNGDARIELSGFQPAEVIAVFGY